MASWWQPSKGNESNLIRDIPLRARRRKKWNVSSSSLLKIRMTRPPPTRDESTLFWEVNEIDLEYSIKVEREEPPVPPDWAVELAEDNDTSGTGGTRAGFEVYTADTSRLIYRWTPKHNEKARGLEEANRWVEFWMERSGLVARPSGWGRPITPNKPPLRTAR